MLKEKSMQARHNRIYTGHYAAIQGSYWMLTCASISYASVYLLDKGYSNSQIGFIMAISNVLAVILQPMVASFADRHKKLELRSITSVFSGGVILAGGILSFLVTESLLLTLLMIFIATIAMVLQPLVNSLSVVYEDSGVNVNFGLARGIGSISYAAISTGMGFLVKEVPKICIPICTCLTATAFTIIVVAFKNREKNQVVTINSVTNEETQEEKASSLLQFVTKNKRFMLFLSGIFLIFFEHQTISIFTLQVIQSYGGSSTEMGIANSIAAIFEFPTMFLMNYFLKKYFCHHLIRFTAVMFAIKHIIILCATTIPMYYVSQAFQIGSYAILIPSSVYYVNRILSKADAIKGQAFVTSAITLASVFASILNGRLLDVTSVHNVLFIATIVAILGSVILFFSVQKIEKA